MRLVVWYPIKLATIFLRCIPVLLRGRNNRALINLDLRQQLATCPEGIQAPDRFRRARLEGISVTAWSEVIVEPDSVICWCRIDSRLY